MTVPNGVVCGGAVAPNYFCPRPSITTSEERRLQTGETHVVIRADCSAFVTADGNYYCQDIFVMDRDDALIAMPIPIVSVRCEMRTEGVIGVINPQIRRPNTFEAQLTWQPRIEFFKTEFGHPTPIRVPALNPSVSKTSTLWIFISMYHYRMDTDILLVKLSMLLLPAPCLVLRQ